MILPLDLFIVAVPGTPIRLTSTQPNPAYPFPVHGVLIQTKEDNTGYIYVKVGTMIVATLAIPTANTIPSFTAALTLAPNAINLADFSIDAAVGGEGARVSVLIA